jgi:hypothetical protein
MDDVDIGGVVERARKLGEDYLSASVVLAERGNTDAAQEVAGHAADILALLAHVAQQREEIKRREEMLTETVRRSDAWRAQVDEHAETIRSLQSLLKSRDEEIERLTDLLEEMQDSVSAKVAAGTKDAVQRAEIAEREWAASKERLASLVEACRPFVDVGKRFLWRYEDSAEALCWASPDGGDLMLSDFRRIADAVAEIDMTDSASHSGRGSPPAPSPQASQAGKERDPTRLPCRDLTDDELNAEEKRVGGAWDDFIEQTRDPNYEGHAGSPGEWMDERLCEIATEQDRRRIKGKSDD